MSRQVSINTLANRVLTKAQELMAGPNGDGAGWIKGEMARTSRRGMSVNANNPNAHCFCSLGATVRAISDLGLEENYKVRTLADNKLRTAMSHWIATANDKRSTTFDQVMTAFEFAKSISPEQVVA